MKVLFAFLYNHRKRTALLAGCWTLFIFIACLIPGRDIPEVRVPLIDKWVHFIIFAGFSLLWSCVLRKGNFYTAVFIGLLTVLTGYAVELLQASGITEGRSFDLYDVLADGIGGLIGLLLFFLLRKRTR